MTDTEATGEVEWGANRSDKTAKDKRSMFKRLFSSSSDHKKSKDEDKKDRKKYERSKTVATSEPEKREKDIKKSAGSKDRHRKSESSASGRKGDSGARKSESGTSGKQTKLERESSVKRRKKKKGPIQIDLSIPLEWPATPEAILEYHKGKPFLSHNEEWLIVELNEFECLVENQEILSIMSKHSKFFELEPDEMFEEFFEFVDDMPTYDEIINWDTWQEFRDVRYPC